MTTEITNRSIVPPYVPFETEIDGLYRINCGIQIIWNEVIEGNCCCCCRKNKEDDGCCLALGIALLGTGVWQLRVPIIVGISSYILYSCGWSRENSSDL